MLNLVSMLVLLLLQKASNSMAENIMLNSVDVSIQPCLTLLVTENASEDSPLSKQTCHCEAVTHHGDEFVQAAKHTHGPPKLFITDSVKDLG